MLKKHHREQIGFLAAAVALLLVFGLFSALLGTGTIASEAQLAAASAVYDADHYFNWETQSYTTIDLADGSVTIDKSGIYVLSGTLAEGSVTVDINKDVDEGTVFLVLNGVSIHSQSGTPVNVVDAKKVVLILEPGTDNTVSQGTAEDADESLESAAIFSKADLTITGSGSLTVTTAYNDGITGKDDFIITDGDITVVAAGDGLVGKDLLGIEDGTITITAGNDGLKSNNDEDAELGCVYIAGGTISIDAGDDAIQAETTLIIDGGTFTLSSGGGYAGVIAQDEEFGDRMMGPDAQAALTTVADESDDTGSGQALKAGALISIAGGTFDISASDDAFNTDGDIVISGGVFTISAGDDALHGENSVTITDGVITITDCYEGFESASAINIDGGVISINSKDDGINISETSGCLTLGGGEITIVTGSDAIDSNGTIVQSGGSVVITLNGTTDVMYVDCDGGFTRTGGTITDANGNDVSTSQNAMGGGKNR